LRIRVERMMNLLTPRGFGVAAGCLILSGLVGAQSIPQPASGQITPEGTITLPSGPPPTTLQSVVPPANHGLQVKGIRLASVSKEELAAILGTKPLTIDDVVSVALGVNRSYASAVESLQKARGRQHEIASQLKPQVNATADITEFDSDNSAVFPGLPAGSPPFIIVNQFNPVYGGTVSFPLDLFGTIKSASSQARFNEIAARIDVNRVRNQLVFDVRSAFYQALRANAQYKVAQSSLSSDLIRLEDARKSYAVGTASRFDVITVQRDVADAQQSLLNSKAQVTISLAQLKNAIGIDISVPIRITDTLGVENPPGVVAYNLPAPDSVDPITKDFPEIKIDPELLEPRFEPQLQRDSGGGDQRSSVVGDLLEFGPEYKQALIEALETRPEIIESEAQIAAARHGLQYAKRSSLPSFGISLGYTYQPNAAGFTKINTGTATLGVTVPLYDGGASAARLEQGQSDVRTAEIGRRNAVDQVTLDVQSAYINLLQGRQRVQVANVGVAQAREAFRLARVRYLAGVSQQQTVSPQIEVSNSQTTLTQAETNLLNALYDYNLARTQLDKAVGRYSYGAGPGFNQIPMIGK